MYVLVRTLGPYYESYANNIAVSRDREALEALKPMDLEDLERQKQAYIDHSDNMAAYQNRYQELEEANPFTKPQPPRCPPKCKIIPVTREEHEARARLKQEVHKVFSAWCDELNAHLEPLKQQAMADTRRARGLPDDYDFDGRWRPDWTYTDEIEVSYRIEEVKEV